jgi:hypothetical protein
VEDLYGVAFLGVVVLGTLAALKWYFPRKFAREDRARRVVPRSAVRDLVADTRVRVIGTAQALDEELIGPHTGKPCLAFIARFCDDHLQVQKKSGVVAFRMHDETGTIDVIVDHVRLDLAPDLHDVEALGAGLIARNNDGRHYAPTLWEHALRPEARVAVVARVARDDRGELTLVGTAKEPVVLSTWQASFEP